MLKRNIKFQLVFNKSKANIENKISLSDQKDPLNMPYPIVYWKKSALEKKVQD